MSKMVEMWEKFENWEYLVNLWDFLPHFECFWPRKSIFAHSLSMIASIMKIPRANHTGTQNQCSDQWVKLTQNDSWTNQWWRRCWGCLSSGQWTRRLLYLMMCWGWHKTEKFTRFLSLFRFTIARGMHLWYVLHEANEKTEKNKTHF